MNLRLLVFVAVSAVLSGCGSAPTTSVAGTDDHARIPANDSLDAVVWTQTAIEHAAVTREIYHLAQDRLLKALADPLWDALPKGERDGEVTGLAPAVIVDVDDTVLDNTPFEARLLRNNAEFNKTAWEIWCEQHSARPLPGALEFAQFAALHGVTVFYITNREAHLGGATRENLKSLGFPLAAGEETLLPDATATPGCSGKSGEKGCRRKLVAQGHRVLLVFGDQLGDFLDGASADNTDRNERVAPYLDWFGERWFALPNPMYGSWMNALTRFPDDPKMKGDARAAKHAALREN